MPIKQLKNGEDIFIWENGEHPYHFELATMMAELPFSRSITSTEIRQLILHVWDCSDCKEYLEKNFVLFPEDLAKMEDCYKVIKKQISNL